MVDSSAWKKAARELARDADMPYPEAKRRTAAPHLLPVKITIGLHGRRRRRLMIDLNHQRPVLITGTTGGGKTALMRSMAADLRRRCPWVESWSIADEKQCFVLGTAVDHFVEPFDHGGAPELLGGRFGDQVNEARKRKPIVVFLDGLYCGIDRTVVFLDAAMRAVGQARGHSVYFVVATQVTFTGELTSYTPVSEEDLAVFGCRIQVFNRGAAGAIAAKPGGAVREFVPTVVASAHCG
ncbi:hypothetical protein [Mycobacterium servetii]|uniref:AAA+ ATPase domain-containing protein n=1 Tax=Mycobacterium servetii TaxID=3237418 RepID=A0ABV4CCQ9_9MYCO